MPRPGTAVAVGLLVVATSVGCGAPVKSPPVASPSTIAAGRTTIAVEYVPGPVAPTTAPVTVPHPVRPEAATRPVTAHVGPDPGDVFDRLARCESGMRNDTTGPYFGYFQFLPSTWRSMGETGMPYDHDYATQKAAAQRLVARSGWSQFPACGRALGMR